MPERRRIFVSHSNSDPDSPAYIDALHQSLSAAGFEVLVDRRRLQPGASWRNDIYTWMGLCHAAVILVSKAAITPGSVWVPRETAILLWRRTLDPNFVVVPACIGGVVAEDLTGGVFADMHLGEIQTAPAATCDQLADALLQRFAALTAPKTPLERLADRITETLAPLSDRAVEEALDALNADLGTCIPRGDLRRGLALTLLQTPLVQAVSALEVIAECMDGARADQILSMIAPSWVDLRAARWVAHCGVQAENKPAVILNAETPFCARMYVSRASCRPPKTRWPMVDSTGVHGEQTTAEIVAEMELNLIQEFRLADDPLMPDARERLRHLLAERQSAGRPVFVTLKWTPAVGAALPGIQRMLPGVTFLVLSGPNFPPPETVAGKRVRLIEPVLARGAEHKALSDFDYVRSVIRPESVLTTYGSNLQ